MPERGERAHLFPRPIDLESLVVVFSWLSLASPYAHTHPSQDHASNPRAIHQYSQRLLLLLPNQRRVLEWQEMSELVQNQQTVTAIS